MMNENFAKEFVSKKLNGKFSDSDLKMILQELQMFATDYEIKSRCTDIVKYSDMTPPCYKVYMVSKRIEGLSKETLKVYDLYLRDFFLYINRPLQEITTNDIRVYLYELQKRRNISNHSLDGKRLVINTFLEWCVGEGYIPTNPCKKIQPIKFEVKPREPLTDTELEFVRDACVTYRERAIIEMLYSTGCRISELVRLDISDINFQSREVHLFGKGNKHRTSYINAKAKVVTEKYLKNRTVGVESGNALFIYDRKPYKRLSKNGIERIVKIIGERSGINRPLYPHLLRHTTATDALNRGMSVAEVQRILGHEKLDTTMIYAKVSSETIKYNHKRYIV